MPTRPSKRQLVQRSSRVLLIAATLALATAVPAAAQGDPLGRAIARFDRGDYAEARTELEALVRANPRDANATYYLGRVAERQERTGEAVDWFEKAVALDDRRSDFHLWLGIALGTETMHASKFRQPFLARRVKTEFERAVALDPRSVQARQGLLRFYVFAPAMMGGGMDRAREQAAAIAAFSPMQGHLAAAFIAQRMKDTAGVLREYEAAVATSPDSAAGYLALGVAYQQLGRWTDAFATYDRLLRRRPNDMKALLQIGRTAALSGQQLERGEQSLRHWLAKIPGDARTATIAGAHHRLGQILEQTGRRDAARAEYGEALRINPANDEARKSLAALR